MTVYQIKPDYRHYQAFMLPTTDLIMRFRRHLSPKEIMHFNAYNLSMRKVWSGVTAKFEPVKGVTESDVTPDITIWIPGVLVLSQRAKNALEAYLQDKGELLSLETPAGTYWAFNCRSVVAPNQEQSDRLVENGAVIDVLSVTFDEAAIRGEQVFKTDFDGCRATYCTASFRQHVESAGLEGLVFSSDLVSPF